MKIRNRTLVRLAGWSATRVIKTLFATVRHSYQPLGSNLDPKHRQDSGRSIYAIWHESLLCPAVLFGRYDIAVLISKHADGQLLAQLIASMGMSTVLGSTNRGGVDAVRKLIANDAPWRHLAVTPDGPRGPRRIVQPGIIYVAARTGMTIVPVGVGYRKPFRFKSWDRFAVPKPFGRATIVTGNPITIPEAIRPDTLEPFRLIVQNEMDRLNDLAQLWADTGVAPLTDQAVPIRLAS